MSQVQDEGILIRRIPYGNTSLIVHVLSAVHGRLSLMAKGARRPKSPLRAALEPLHLLTLAWHAGRTGMGTLAAADRRQPLLPESHMLAGLQLNALASHLFPEGDTHGFSQFGQACILLGERPEESGLLAAAWDMLEKSGLVGSRDHCWGRGNQSNEMYWAGGALHCDVCGGEMIVSPGLRRGILGHMCSPRVYLPQHDIGTWRIMVQDVLARHGLKPLSL